MATQIPIIVSDFETSLSLAVSEGDTTASVLSIVDTDGNTLTPGLYGFTIDNDTDYKEYILADLAGTALTNIYSVSDQGVATVGFSTYHRRGATVQLTDHVGLQRVAATLRGDIDLNGGVPLEYDSAPALGSPNQLATVQYVLDTVNGGAVSFNATTIAGNAGETVADGEWVYLDTSDGEWYLTDADVIAKSLGVQIGKARGAGTNGNPISGGVFIDGLETVGTYTPGQAYYLGNTAGALSTSPGTNSVLVGYGDANGDLILNKVKQSTVDASTGSVGVPSSSNKFITEANTTNAETDQSQTTQNATTVFGDADTSGNRNEVAQSFVPTSYKTRGVRLYKAADTGTFTGTVTISLQADTAGSPSGVDLASVTLSNALWATIPAGVFDAIFSASYDTDPGTTYWIVASSSTADNSNHPNLGTSGTSTYANGILKYNNAADGWVTTTTDLYFVTLNSNANQVVTTSSEGFAQQIQLRTNLLLDVSAGTAITGTTAETTSYSNTVDSTRLNVKGLGIKLVTNSLLTTQNSTNQTTTLRVKIGGITIFSESVGGAASSSSITIQLRTEVYVFTNSSGVQQYIYTIIGGTNLVSVSASPYIVNIYRRGSGTLSTRITPSTSSAILTTFQNASNNFTAQTLDMCVEII